MSIEESLNESYQKVLLVRKVDLGGIVLKPNTKLLIKRKDDKLYLNYENVELMVSIQDICKKENCKLNELFVTEEEVCKAMVLGSELSLITNKGLCTYSVEGIDFKDKSVAYATLYLKIL